MLVPPRSQQAGVMISSSFTQCAWLVLIPAGHVATTACPCGGLVQFFLHANYPSSSAQNIGWFRFVRVREIVSVHVCSEVTVLPKHLATLRA